MDVPCIPLRSRCVYMKAQDVPKDKCLQRNCNEFG